MRNFPNQFKERFYYDLDNLSSVVKIEYEFEFAKYSFTTRKLESIPFGFEIFISGTIKYTI